MRNSLTRITLALAMILALPVASRATDVDGPDCQQNPSDFGDAPEGVLAYPGVLGHFPTCIFPGPPGNATSDCGAVLPVPGQTGYVKHIHPVGTVNYWIGCNGAAAPMGIDNDADGKMNDTGGPQSACSAIPVDCTETAFGLTFGQDENYGGTDAGLTAPPIFNTCQTSTFSFGVYNCGPQRQVIVNVLVDWNHDGDWNDEVSCPNSPANPCVSEWAVKNLSTTVLAGCTNLVVPITGGPTPGPAWMRITISDNPVPPDFTWNGSVSVPGQVLINGETEDYPVTVRTPPQGCLDYEDWGDAPEGVQAYPGVPGHFPTCSGPAATAGSAQLACLPSRSIPPSAADMAGFVRHLVSAAAPQGFWLGCGDGTAANPGVDSETDGKVNDNGGPNSACLATLLTDCTEFLGLNWGQDECYGDLDAGVVSPTNLIFKTCQPASFDFRTFNCKQQADAFLNVLVDMNGDGDWNDNFQCAGQPACAYEWAVKNQVIAVNPGCQLHTTPLFLMGPQDGVGWMRITLTSTPVADDFPWRGSAGAGGDGIFTAGETEDYPVVIRPPNVGVGETPDDFTHLAFAPLTPNPAKDNVTMRFTLPQRSDVSLAAFDLAGRKLAQLASGQLEAGEHRIAWDFKGRDGRAVAAGYYLIKLRVGDRVLTQRGIRVR